MKMPSLARAFGLSLLLLPGCSDTTAPRPPEPGLLTITLATPHDDDAALVLTVVSPQGITPAVIEAVPGSGEEPLVYHRQSEATTRVAIVGTIVDGALVRFSVPDVNRAGDYTVQLVEVADGSNALRESLTGYSVTVTRPQ
jgi:hypothetical protein